MANKIAMRVVISGDVQGVGFREFARRTGAGLGLVGWVRNWTDGRVEAQVEGDAPSVRRMIERCRAGPPASRVTLVDAVPSDPEGVAHFEIRSSSPGGEGVPGGGTPDPRDRGAPFQSPDG